ncbi:MAG: hypothetical protein JO212_10530, partial [Acetobacteraceae bacterium]|nr:hypothetical protein [Acetobacteraceae bacterium]
GMRALPLAVPALLVLLAALPELYPWARNGVWVGNSWYLNTHFFTGRLVLYAVVWVVLWALVSLGVYRGWTMMWLAPPALMLLMLTCTYMSIDTVMSLEPKFKSSDWGMVTASAGGLYALAIAALSVAGRPEVRDDLAQLLLGLLALWAYLEFMQILIIWQGNLPNEIYWYLIRSVGLWAWLAGLITLGHFMVPFFALLRQRWRRSRAVLVTVAGLIVAMEIVRNWWLVIPEAGRGIRLVDAAAVLALGGISAAIAIRPIRRARSFEHA